MAPTALNHCFNSVRQTSLALRTRAVELGHKSIHKSLS